MKSRLGIAALRVVLPFALTLACSKSDTGSAQDAGAEPGTDSGALAGRGTPACHAWQRAICAWSVQCTAVAVSDCLDQVTAFACASDPKAQACASSLNAAVSADAAAGSGGPVCDNPPPGCLITDVADPAPARTACNQLIDTYCAGLNRCDMSQTIDACRQDAATLLNCAKALGVKASFEQCISDINAAACPISALPTNCQGTILLSN